MSGKLKPHPECQNGGIRAEAWKLSSGAKEKGIRSIKLNTDNKNAWIENWLTKIKIKLEKKKKGIF